MSRVRPKHMSVAPHCASSAQSPPSGTCPATHRPVLVLQTSVPWHPPLGASQRGTQAVFTQISCGSPQSASSAQGGGGGGASQRPLRLLHWLVAPEHWT